MMRLTVSLADWRKRTKSFLPNEKKIVAYHEAGHAVAGWFLEHADPLVKVSIVPRGIAALGYAQYCPKNSSSIRLSNSWMRCAWHLGGRAAEEIIFGKISTGALSDLERVTKMAYSMVTVYGMNNKIGNVSFYDSKQADYAFTKPYSDQTAETIDNEVRMLIEKAYNRTKDLLLKHKKELNTLAEKLLEKEIIFQSDLEGLIGKRPFEGQTTYEAYTNGQAEDSKKVADEEKKEVGGEEKKKPSQKTSAPESSTEPVEEKPDLTK